jgi:pilus assembly protein CpaE
MINVLLVEDDHDYAVLVIHWLSGQENTSEFSVSWVENLASAKQRLEQGGVDLVLLDLNLPDAAGIATFESMAGVAGQLPVIVLSAADHEALALQTIQMGAEDYLVKSNCSPEQLARSLRHAVVRHHRTPEVAAIDTERRAAKIVGVVGAAGGVGTTTVASVVAAELMHHTGQGTVLMDLDVNPGMLAFLLGLEAKHTHVDLERLRNRLDMAGWESMVVKRPGNLHVFAPAKSAALSSPDPNFQREAVSFAASQYPWVVLDLGRLSNQSAQLVDMADELVLVSALSLPALYQCKSAVSGLRDLGIEWKRLRMVLNRLHESEPLSLKEVEGLFGVPVEATLPASHSDLYESQLKKRLPSVSGPYRTALTRVARRIAGLDVQNTQHSIFSLDHWKGKLSPLIKPLQPVRPH